MKNKSMISLWSVNILLIFGTTVAILFSTSSQMQMVSASVEGGAPASNTSKSSEGTGSAAQCTRNPHEPPCNQGTQQNNADISCEMDPEKCVPPNNAEQSQGGSQGVPSVSNTSNSDQSAAESLNPCITDPNKCKPTNNAEESQGSSQGTTPASSSGGVSSNSNQQAIDHINQAQSALQNGDTAGAQQHMDLAKQSLHCEGCEPTN
jgi:hypothetical protein